MNLNYTTSSASSASSLSSYSDCAMTIETTESAQIIDTLNNSFLLCNTSIINNSHSEGPDEEYVYFLDQSRFWIQRVLVPIIMIIGVIGNSITIVIMTRRRMRSSTNWYLAALAIFDMLYLIFTFVLSFRHYPNIKDQKFYYYWLLWPIAVMICDGSSNTSIWLTVTFTIERYIAVCHPMRGKVLCTESRARKLIFCVFIVCFAFTIPTPFEWTILELKNEETNETYLQVSFSDFGQNELYKTIYYWSTVVLFVFVPLLLLTIFNCFLIRSVHISHRQRRTMTRPNEAAMRQSSSVPSERSSSVSGDASSKQESRITLMLIAVVILFLICQLPTAITLIYSAFHNIDQNTNLNILIRALGNIFNFLMAINAGGNFVLYCLLSQKYRKTFVQIFCPCLKGKVQRLQSAYCKSTVYSQVNDKREQTNRKLKISQSTLGTGQCSPSGPNTHEPCGPNGQSTEDIPEHMPARRIVSFSDENEHQTRNIKPLYDIRSKRNNFVSLRIAEGVDVSGDHNDHNGAMVNPVIDNDNDK